MLKLLTLLEGEALTVWLELSKDEQSNYGETKKSAISSSLCVTGWLS